MIKLRFTAANVRNKNRLVRFPTISISHTNTKITVKKRRIKMAAAGVRVRGCTYAKNLGSECSFAMPYMSRDVVTRLIKTVFAVEKSAMMPRSINALLPKKACATLASGAEDWESSSHPRMLTADTATRTYSTEVIINERINARGIVFVGFLVSSASLTMLSNPIYAKKTKALALKTPESHSGIAK